MRMIPLRLVAAAVLAAAMALPAAAQTTTTTTTTSSSTTTTTVSPGERPESVETRQQRVEERIADMYASLHITPAQDQQWNAFAQVMLDNAQAMDALLSQHAADPSKRTAEDILQSYAAISQQHTQNVQKLAAAFHTLYASLSDKQRQDADEMFRANALHRDRK